MSIVNIPKPEESFFITKIYSQNFTFPDPLLHYIKMNPTTPKLCINLLNSCKYFYCKKDLLIPLNGNFYDNFSRYNFGKIIQSQKDPLKYKLPFNVWLDGCLSLDANGVEYFQHHFFVNFYFFKHAKRCSLRRLHLRLQRLTFKELQFLTQNGLEDFNCGSTIVKYSNGIIVSVEEIIGLLKNIKVLNYTFEKETAKLVTTETAKILIKIIDTSMLQRFFLQFIPPSFDFELFKKFTEAHTSIYFYISTCPS